MGFDHVVGFDTSTMLPPQPVLSAIINAVDIELDVAGQVSDAIAASELSIAALPTYPAVADVLLALAYAATPVGGTLNLGDRDINLTSTLTINKKIRVVGGRIHVSGAPAFIVEAADVEFDRVTIERTVVGASTSALSWRGARGILRNCNISCETGAAFNGGAGLCDGTIIDGGKFSSSAAKSTTVIWFNSGAQNDNITVKNTDVSYTGSGFGSGIALYSASNSVVFNNKVHAIRTAPWHAFTSGWTVFSGSVYRQLDRTDIPESNAVWVGSDADWANDKVEYTQQSATSTLSAGRYNTPGDGYIYIRLASSGDPNDVTVKTRRTDGYGILFYSTNSATAGIANNLVADNRVWDTDGFGIYFKAGQGTPTTNRSRNNLLEDVCKMGIAVGTLPFAGIGALGNTSLNMTNDVIRRAGTTAYPVPGVYILHDSASSQFTKSILQGVRVEEPSASGYFLGLGVHKLSNCVVQNAGTTGFINNNNAAGECTIEMIGCEAIGCGTALASSGAQFSGTTSTCSVSIIGGRFMNNALRGIQLTTCVESKILGVTTGGNAQQGINIASSCARLIIDSPILIGDDDVIIASGTTALTLRTGSEGSGTTYTISCTNWRTGDNTYAGTGSPESVLAAPVGSLYRRVDGGAGTCLYMKESGTGTTG